MVTPHLPPMQAAVALLPVVLGEALSTAGVTTTFVSHPAAGDGRSTMADRRSPITYVPRRGSGVFDRSMPGAVSTAMAMALQARKAIASCDVVHLHSNGFLVEVCAWLAKRYGKPYIITLYGTDVSAHDPVKNARYGDVVRGASARVFYSRGLLEAASGLGLAPPPSTVIYAPVNAGFQVADDKTRLALRRELGVSTGPLLLTVKHLRPVCGHDTLLDSIPAILQAHPDATFCIAGDGDQRVRLEAKSRDLGISPNVRFVGRIENDTVWKYYAAADVFVLPSYVESWGTVMLESMACGTPVVTTDTVGGLEVHANFPEDVLVVPRHDVESLAQAVARALAEPRRVSRAALERITRTFSVAACASQYLELYREALARR